jgi:hypothetical protein
MRDQIRTRSMIRAKLNAINPISARSRRPIGAQGAQKVYLSPSGYAR